MSTIGSICARRRLSLFLFQPDDLRRSRRHILFRFFPDDKVAPGGAFPSLLFQASLFLRPPLHFVRSDFPNFLIVILLPSPCRAAARSKTAIANARLCKKAHLRRAYPRVQPLFPRLGASGCPAMPYTDLMTGRDTGPEKITRESPAFRGAGEVCLWQERGTAARGARAGRRQALPVPLCRAPLPIRPPGLPGSSLSVPLRARPPAPIMTQRWRRAPHDLPRLPKEFPTWP